MLPKALGIVGVLVAAAFMGLAFAPAASATRYDIDITKVIRGYTIHVVGWIDVDQTAKTITGHLHVTVTDPSGSIVFEKDYDFSFNWSSVPKPITFIVPGANLLASISLDGTGLSVTTVPFLNPSPMQLRRGRLSLLEN